MVLGTSVLISRALCTSSHGGAGASIGLVTQTKGLVAANTRSKCWVFFFFFLKLHVSGVKLQLDKVTGRIFKRRKGRRRGACSSAPPPKFLFERVKINRL